MGMGLATASGMRAAIVLGLTLLGAACSEESARRLGGGPVDGGAADARRPPDGGARGDASVADARRVPDAQTSLDASTLPQCAQDGATLRFWHRDADGRPREVDSLVAPGTIVSVSSERILFALADRTSLEVLFDRPVPNLDRLRLGERVDVRVDVERPFWLETRLLATRRSDKALVGAFWSGASWREWAIDADHRVRHRDAACRLPLGCVPGRGQQLEVERSADAILVDPNRSRSEGSFTAINGASARFVDGELCPDNPTAWYEGAIFVHGAVDDCDTLGRDDCIASPDCALHFSEIYDPGYACHPAILECERFDDVGCRALGQCRFTSGECYCPEEEVCGCGGGPPPGCLSRCDPFTDGILCGDRSEYFCELEAPPSTAECSVFAEGVCERIPTDCDGTPNGRDVCGCPEVSTNGQPVLFASDCLRRRSAAFPVAKVLCSGP